MNIYLYVGQEKAVIIVGEVIGNMSKIEEILVAPVKKYRIGLADPNLPPGTIAVVKIDNLSKWEPLGTLII